MKRPEFSASNPELPFVEVSLTEIDVEINGDQWVLQTLRDIAREEGYSPDQLLYRGFDRSDIDASGDFVYLRFQDSHPEGLWAFTDEEFALSAQRTAEIGERFPDSPLFYALKGPDEPAIALLDSEKLQRIPDHDTQYVSFPGLRLEDALIAVVNFTH